MAISDSMSKPSRGPDLKRDRPILVIDDDPRSCDLITGIFAGSEFEVLSAHDGPSGIEIARVTQPAVIILDMMMPGVDGVRTCQRLKRDPVLGDIPVVGFTASADLKYNERAFRAGAEFFLSKPVRAASLLHTVELAVEGAKTRRRRPIPAPRFPAEIPVRCTVGGDTGTARDVIGETDNVSLGGLLLWLPERLASGTVFRLRLGFPKGPIHAEGVVVWQNLKPTNDGGIRHGIQLLRFVEGSGVVRYRRFLSQIAAYPAELR
ncbi:MAG: response regulator [Candidatus Methylomirabilales bacterium]